MSKPSPCATRSDIPTCQTHRFPFTPSYRCTPQKEPSTVDKHPLLSKQAQPAGRCTPRCITHKYPNYTQSTNTSSHAGPSIQRQLPNTPNSQPNPLTPQLTVDAPTQIHAQTQVPNIPQPMTCSVWSHVSSSPETPFFKLVQASRGKTFHLHHGEENNCQTGSDGSLPLVPISFLAPGCRICFQSSQKSSI